MGAERGGDRGAARRGRGSEPLRRWFVSCPRGLEELLADEIRECAGAEARVLGGGVGFDGTLEQGYLVCLHSRLGSRVIALLTEVDAADAARLHDGVADQPWESHLPPGASLAVDFSGTSSSLRNTLFGARCVKDGVVDRLRALTGARPDVDLQAPDVRIVARLQRDRVTLGIDVSGEALHRRGYRTGTGAAPLKENLAAAMLLRAGWPQAAARGAPLFDPLCGSGTLLIEGATMARRQAPGRRRAIGAQRWLGHDAALWQRLVVATDAGAGPARAAIIGADADGRVLERAAANAAAAGVAADIVLHDREVGDWDGLRGLDAEDGVLVCNPPYGERMGSLASLLPVYGRLGDAVRERLPGWRAAVLTVDGPLVAALGAGFERGYKVFNGGIECRLLVRDPARRAARAARAERAGAQQHVAPEPLGEGARMFANRLEKNLRRLKGWLGNAGTDCYRLYDADIPEYAVAVDRYGEWVHVAEYAAPSSVDPAIAEARLRDVQRALTEVLGVPPAHIAVKQRSRQRGSAQYERLARENHFILVREGAARLRVNLRDFLDTGLFLDHRPVRRMLARMAAGKSFLNLFCYTATATVQAALGGARASTSVDMSATYLDWAQRNFEQNGMAAAAHELLQADCVQWMEHETRRWDLVFLDPPSFSNSKRMHGTLDVQRDHPALIRAALGLLAPGGTLVFSTNRRGFRLETEALPGLAVRDVSAASCDPDFNRPRLPHRVFLMQPA